MPESQKIVFNNRIIHRPKNPILIAEDTPAARSLLEKICKQMFLEFVSVENGKQAMDLLDQGKKFSIYIVDLNMPVMDGKTFTQNLKMFEPEAVVIVQTALDQSSTIIELMKLGVYDYIIKPLELTLVEQSILNALEYKHLKETEKQMTINSAEKLRNQLEWLTYKDSRKKTDKDTHETQTIYNLKTSLAQGGGFGTIITIIDIMQMSHKISDGKYCFDKETVDVLFDNAKVARQAIEGLDIVDKIMSSTFDKEDVSALDIVKQIPEFLKGLLEYTNARNIRLSYPSLTSDFKVHVNVKYIFSAIKELVINAVKYSKKNSTIGIFTQLSDGYFVIGVKNDVTESGKIPENAEKLIVEPFYRAHPPVEDAVPLEEFSLGLGLTAVEYITNKHNGVFFINNAKDHTTEVSHDCVIAQMLIPIKV